MGADDFHVSADLSRRDAERWIITNEDTTFAMGPIRLFKDGNDFLEFARQEIASYDLGGEFSLGDAKIEICITSDVNIPSDVVVVIDDGCISIEKFYTASVKWEA